MSAFSHFMSTYVRIFCFIIILVNRFAIFIIKEYYLNEFFSELFSAGVWGRIPPSTPKWNKWIHRNLSNKHCSKCLTLDGCWFQGDKTPLWPHHPLCHCILEDIPYSDVLTKCSSNSAYSKFDPYLFNPEGKYPHNKEKLFNSWGHTISDAKWLQAEIEKQGLEKYINGEYTLGKLDYNGQRISIRVEIPRKDQSGNVSFVTGWKVYPNGRIQLATPYGGK